MRLLLCTLWVLISVTGYCQNKGFKENKVFKFYNEDGLELSRKEFYQSRKNSSNVQIYLENDTARFGILYYREKYGVLKDSTFNDLKNYLNTFKSDQIGSEDFIVINFLTGVSIEEQKKRSRSTWNIFNRNYIKKLNKITDVSHFWISSIEKEKLKYFYSNRVDWYKDEKNLIKKLFFPFELSYGYYIIINPEGEYYYYLGEYSKYNIWEKTEEMLNL